MSEWHLRVNRDMKRIYVRRAALGSSFIFCTSLESIRSFFPIIRGILQSAEVFKMRHMESECRYIGGQQHHSWNFDEYIRQ